MNEHEHAHSGTYGHYGHASSKGKIPTYAVYAAVAIVCLVIGYFAYGALNPAQQPTGTASTSTCGVPSPTPTVDLAALKTNVGDYLTALVAINAAQQGSYAQGITAVATGVTQQNGMYAVGVNFVKDSAVVQNYTFYVTLDGTRLFTSSPNDLTQKLVVPTPVAQTKSATPVVDMYVMSFCPYGQQAEEGLGPAVKALNGTIKFEPHFIVSPDGTSLHGANEVTEDERQLCILQNYSQAAWWSYVTYFDNNCTVGTINGSLGTPDGCWQKAAAAAGIDAAKVQSCIAADGQTLLAAEEVATATNQVASSPTIYINGVSYSGGRDAASFQSGICAAFNKAPAACGTVQSSATAATTGSCNPAK